MSKQGQVMMTDSSDTEFVEKVYRVNAQNCLLISVVCRGDWHRPWIMINTTIETFTQHIIYRLQFFTAQGAVVK